MFPVSVLVLIRVRVHVRALSVSISYQVIETDAHGVALLLLRRVRELL